MTRKNDFPRGTGKKSGPFLSESNTNNRNIPARGGVEVVRNKRYSTAEKPKKTHVTNSTGGDHGTRTARFSLVNPARFVM